MQSQATRIFPLAVLGGILLAAFDVSASSCKALEQEACAAEPSCSWITGYQRSDGREIKSYCRTAPSKRDRLGSSLNQAEQSDS